MQTKTIQQLADAATAGDAEIVRRLLLADTDGVRDDGSRVPPEDDAVLAALLQEHGAVE